MTIQINGGNGSDGAYLFSIPLIEEELKTGQVAPQRLAEMSDWLSGTSSSLMDRQLELQISFAKFFDLFREDVKSDKALLEKWYTQPGGLEQLKLENTQRKIKVLLQTIGRHLRVAHDQTFNLH